MSYNTELDHIVVACNTLDEGRAWCREIFGVESSGGGKHAGIGTHNTLLSLGAKHYLEIIAVDPDAPAASFPRWFGLDTEEVKLLIAHEPRLVGWVARVSPQSEANAIERVAQVKENPACIVRPAERGDFRWRFAFTRDGARPRLGVLPYLIQWDVAIHPSDRWVDSGVSLSTLMLGDPQPERVAFALDAMQFADAKVQIGQSVSTQLVATLNAPKGQVILE